MATNTTVPLPSTARASDDEILGLTTKVTRKASKAAEKEGSRPTAGAQAETDDFFADSELPGKLGGQLSGKLNGNLSSNEVRDLDDANSEADAAGNPSDSEKLNAALDANSELRDAWHDAKAYREVFATPAEAQAATKLLGDLNRMDALFYSRRPEDHAELARAVSQLDPQSFASLARAMSELAARPATHGRGNEAAGANRLERGLEHSANPGSRAAETAQPAAVAGAAGLTPAQSDFFQATNAAAVQSVMEAIETQVERLLPDGISKSARNRVAGEIYRELDTTLQGNRALGQQMRDAFRSGAMDEAHRKAIVSLVTGRARRRCQALPNAC